MSKKSKSESLAELKQVDNALQNKQEPLSIDEVRLSAIDTAKDIDAMPPGETKVVALEILGKVRLMLDSLTPQKMAAMDGKSLSSAIGENLMTLQKLAGKGTADNNITVVIQNFADGSKAAVQVVQTPG